MHAQVGVGIANDSVKFFKDYNVSIKAVEDLSYLANQKLCGDTQNWGLASLTEKLICKQVLLGFSLLSTILHFLYLLLYLGNLSKTTVLMEYRFTPTYVILAFNL